MGLLGLAAVDFVGLGGFEPGPPFGVPESDLYFSELTSCPVVSGDLLLAKSEVQKTSSKNNKIQ